MLSIIDIIEWLRLVVVERGINVSSGIVTFLSRKEFMFSGEDDC